MVTKGWSTDVEKEPVWAAAREASRERALRAWSIYTGALENGVGSKDSSDAYVAASSHVRKLIMYGSRPRMKIVREARLRRAFLIEYVLIAEGRVPFA